MEVIVERESEREPLLKYKRLAEKSLLFGDPSHNIKISCVAVHPKFVALGVLHQTVYVLDHNGVLKHKFLQQHSAKINQISFDEDGLFLASCADDGVVSIVGLSSEYKDTIAFNKQVKSVALHSRYTPAHAVVAVGTDQLLLVEERRLLPGKKRTELCKANGPISTMQWKNDLIAFADLKTVTVYDMNARNVVASMAFDEESRWASYLPCSLYWKSNTDLLVGRGHYVKILVVVPEEKRVSTVAENVLGGVFVCGVVPLSGESDKDWKLAVLGYRDTLEGMKQGKVPPPRVLVVSPRRLLDGLPESCSGWCPELIARDTLRNIRGYQNSRLNEYHMACFAGEKKFYIVSPNDVIKMEECDAIDHIDWLMERKAFEEALQYAEDPKTKGLLNPQSKYKDIGIMLLFDLIETGKIPEAALRCPQILGPEDKPKWEEIIMKLSGNMSEIAPFVPTKDPVLSTEIYELVLRELLQKDSCKLLDVIKNWPSTLYNVQSLGPAVENKLCQVLANSGDSSMQQRWADNPPDNSSEVGNLLKVLAVLDDHCGSSAVDSPSRELQYTYKHATVFHLVHHMKLYGALMKNLIPFMSLNSKATVKLLVDLPSEWILKELEADGNKTHHLMYLEGLYLNAVHADYFEKVVELCTELQPERVQQILQSCTDIHLQKALRCQEMMKQRGHDWSEKSKDNLSVLNAEGAHKEPDGLQKSKELAEAKHEAQGSKAPPVVEQTPGTLLLQLQKKLQQAEERVRQVENERDAMMHQAENALKKAEESAMAAEREAKEVLEQMIQQAEKAVNEANERTAAAECEASVTRKREEESRLRLAAMQQDIARMQELVTTALARAESAEQRAHEAETRVQDAQGEQQYWLVKKDEVELTGQEVGAGAWAAVKIAHFRGLRVAAKCLHNAIITPHNCRLFMREMSIAAHVRHPNLVQFIGATLEGNPILLLELMSTSLRAQLGHGPLLHAQSKSICQDVAKALNYLHLMKPKEIIHRDISSANVLLEPSGTDTWKAKLSDYGSANFLQLINTVAPGGPAYAAPESLTPELQSPKMDVFSYGVLLMEIFVSEFPDPATRKDTMQRIQHPLIAGLVRQCLEMKPEDRPPMSYILQQLHDL